MKTKYLLFLIFLQLSVYTFSQDSLIIYYNSKWEKVNEKNSARYFRIAFRNNINWIVKDYYYSDSLLQMEGIYKTSQFKVKNGHFIFYYQNGNIKLDGYFKENNPDGKWLSYYNNGKLYSEGVYKDSLKINTWKTYYMNGNIYSIEKYGNGKLNGKSNWYFDNGKIASEELYENGKLKNITYWNKKRRKIKGKLKVKEYPEFKGGNEKLKKFIAKNSIYPNELKEKGIQGKVIVKFMVNTKGNVSKTEIVQSINSILDKEAERVVLSLPKFKPAKMHNLPVNFWYQIPVIFKLN